MGGDEPTASKQVQAHSLAATPFLPPSPFPPLQVYAYYGDLVQKVDAGRPIDDVFADVSTIIDASFA